MNNPSKRACGIAWLCAVLGFAGAAAWGYDYDENDESQGAGADAAGGGSPVAVQASLRRLKSAAGHATRVLYRRLALWMTTVHLLGTAKPRLLSLGLPAGPPVRLALAPAPEEPMSP